MPIQVASDATWVVWSDYADESVVLSNDPVTPSAFILVMMTVAELHREVYLPLVVKNSESVICNVIAAPGNILRRCIGYFSVH